MTVKTRGKPQTTHTYQTRTGRAASTTNDQNTPDDCANASATRVHMTAHYHQACTGERFKSTQGHQTGGQQQKYTHIENAPVSRLLNPPHSTALCPEIACCRRNELAVKLGGQGQGGEMQELLLSNTQKRDAAIKDTQRGTAGTYTGPVIYRTALATARGGKAGRIVYYTY